MFSLTSLALDRERERTELAVSELRGDCKGLGGEGAGCQTGEIDDSGQIKMLCYISLSSGVTNRWKMEQTHQYGLNITY